MTALSQRSRAIARTGIALMTMAVAAAVLPATTYAQATRTWVSGVGDDANPCSRTAPCKTFAGAISKTAASGEIDALDPGGFGAVTITKAITIVGPSYGSGGGILAALTNGVIINAGVNDKVQLRNLDIQGVGTAINGVRILKAKSVQISRSTIAGAAHDGVQISPASGARVLIQNSTITDNADNGVSVSGGAGRVTLNRVNLYGNGCGVTAGPRGFTLNPPPASFTQACGLLGSGTPTPVNINIVRSHISDNAQVGVRASADEATIRMAHSDVTSNGIGLLATAGAKLLSLGDNAVFGNDTDGDPTGTFAPK